MSVRNILIIIALQNVSFHVAKVILLQCERCLIGLWVCPFAAIQECHLRGR